MVSVGAGVTPILQEGSFPNQKAGTLGKGSKVEMGGGGPFLKWFDHLPPINGTKSVNKSDIMVNLAM